jgi:uncharacterized protein (TIGR00645 family)
MSDHTRIENVADAVHDLADNAVHSTVDSGVKWFHRAESVLEAVLYAGRWMLAPLYVGLLASLAVLLVRFWNAFIAMLGHAADGSLQTLTLEILELLDMTLLGNLVVIMILSGYENFVSKIHAADKSVDRPAWMGRVDFSGLKIKLIGSLVAISVIELLRDFIGVQSQSDRDVKLRIAIHVTFLFSGVLFALMDYVAEKRGMVEAQVERIRLENEKLR